MRQVVDLHDYCLVSFIRDRSTCFLQIASSNYVFFQYKQVSNLAKGDNFHGLSDLAAHFPKLHHVFCMIVTHDVIYLLYNLSKGINKILSALCICCSVEVLCHVLRLCFLVSWLKGFNKSVKIIVRINKCLLETGKFWTKFKIITCLVNQVLWSIQESNGISYFPYELAKRC